MAKGCSVMKRILVALCALLFVPSATSAGVLVALGGTKEVFRTHEITQIDFIIEVEEDRPIPSDQDAFIGSHLLASFPNTDVHGVVILTKPDDAFHLLADQLTNGTHQHYSVQWESWPGRAGTGSGFDESEIFNPDCPQFCDPNADEYFFGETINGIDLEDFRITAIKFEYWNTYVDCTDSKNAERCNNNALEGAFLRFAVRVFGSELPGPSSLPLVLIGFAGFTIIGRKIPSKLRS